MSSNDVIMVTTKPPFHHHLKIQNTFIKELNLRKHKKQQQKKVRTPLIFKLANLHPSVII